MLVYELFAVDAVLVTVEDDVDGERDSDAAAARPNATRLAPGVWRAARASAETKHVTIGLRGACSSASRVP